MTENMRNWLDELATIEPIEIPPELIDADWRLGAE